jgi:hypothetical protein
MDKDMSKPEHRLLAKSVTNGVDVSRELLGAAGAPSAVTVVAVMENETRDETIRLAAARRQRPILLTGLARPRVRERPCRDMSTPKFVQKLRIE